MSASKSGDTGVAYVRLTTIGGRPLSYASAAAFEAAGWTLAYFADGTLSAAKVYTMVVQSGSAKENALGALGWHKITWTMQDALEDVAVAAPRGCEAWPERQRGLVEGYDLDSLAAVVAAPVLSVITVGGPQGDITLRFVKDSYAEVVFDVTDQAGTAIDLSGYTTPKFGVKSADGTTTVYQQTSGITMSAAGRVTILVPETAGFFAALTSGLIAAGTYQVTLYWNFDADQAADAAKTRTLARGTLEVVRKETT